MSKDQRDTSQTTDWREAMKAREMGTILRHLYIALGAATMVNDEEVISQLKPIIFRYREKTADDLEGTPYE